MQIRELVISLETSGIPFDNDAYYHAIDLTTRLFLMLTAFRHVTPTQRPARSAYKVFFYITKMSRNRITQRRRKCTKVSKKMIQWKFFLKIKKKILSYGGSKILLWEGGITDRKRELDEFFLL